MSGMVNDASDAGEYENINDSEPAAYLEPVSMQGHEEDGAGYLDIGDPALGAEA